MNFDEPSRDITADDLMEILSSGADSSDIDAADSSGGSGGTSPAPSTVDPSAALLDSLEDLKSNDPEAANSLLLDLLADAATGSASVIENEGTGNLDTDLENWFNGADNIPSSPLAAYIANAPSKLEMGLKKHSISSFGLIAALENFISDAASTAFDAAALAVLDPSEVNNRIRLAFTIWKDLYLMNQKTYALLKDLKLKGDDVGDDTDELRTLLQSIPDSKLRNMLQALNEQ